MKDDFPILIVWGQIEGPVYPLRLGGVKVWELSDLSPETLFDTALRLLPYIVSDDGEILPWPSGERVRSLEMEFSSAAEKGRLKCVKVRAKEGTEEKNYLLFFIPIDDEYFLSVGLWRVIESMWYDVTDVTRAFPEWRTHWHEEVDDDD